MNKICLGCGSILQTENEEKEGFVLDINHDYCLRCFKMINYGESKIINKEVDRTSLIKKINNSKNSVIYVLDILNISDELLKPIKEITNKVYIVLTKKDLLPKSVKDEKLINYVYERTLVKDIFVVSSTKNYNIDNLKRTLEKNNEREVYILGNTNQGKSSLINSLLETSGKNKSLTISTTLNTTLEEIKVKLTDKLTLIDTPGFVDNKSILNYVKPSTYKSLIPKKEIKPKVHTLKPEFMIILGNIIRIENNTSNEVNLIFYFKNEISLEKMRSIRNNKLKENEKVNIKTNNEDIIVEGLGFIKVVGTSNLDIYSINKDIILKRDKLI